jgi:hypothetical protein
MYLRCLSPSCVLIVGPQTAAQCFPAVSLKGRFDSGESAPAADPPGLGRSRPGPQALDGATAPLHGQSQPRQALGSRNESAARSGAYVKPFACMLHLDVRLLVCC